jgi:hypothetical protein
MNAALWGDLAAGELLEQRAGVQRLDVLEHVLLADVDRAQIWELDPRLGFLLCPAGRDCIGDGGLPAKEDRSLLVHVDRSVTGPCPGMRVWMSSARMISSELSHWSTIARLPDITVAPTGWEQIGLQRSERQPGLLRFSPPRSLTWAVSAQDASPFCAGWGWAPGVATSRGQGQASRPPGR